MIEKYILHKNALLDNTDIIYLENIGYTINCLSVMCTITDTLELEKARTKGEQMKFTHKNRNLMNSILGYFNLMQ